MKRHQVRRFNLRGFSYHLIYRIEENAMVIYAVAHHKRRPGYWSGRLNKQNDQNENPSQRMNALRTLIIMG
jgi:hypothetical protein